MTSESARTGHGHATAMPPPPPPPGFRSSDDSAPSGSYAECCPPSLSVCSVIDGTLPAPNFGWSPDDDSCRLATTTTTPTRRGAFLDNYDHTESDSYQNDRDDETRRKTAGVVTSFMIQSPAALRLPSSPTYLTAIFDGAVDQQTKKPRRFAPLIVQISPPLTFEGRVTVPAPLRPPSPAELQFLSAQFSESRI